MNRSKLSMLCFMLLMIIALSACERSASTMPVVKATATLELPFPIGTKGDAQGNEGSPEKLTRTPAALGTQPTIGSLTQTSIAKGTPLKKNTSMPSKTKTNQPLKTSTPKVTATEVFVPSATPGLPETYTLHDGEWPYCLARRFNVDAGELLTLNGLGADARPSAGTSLKIPQDGKPWSSGEKARKSHPATYTAKQGETIYSIACEFGDADPDAIAYANNLEEPYTLQPGMELYIP